MEMNKNRAEMDGSYWMWYLILKFSRFYNLCGLLEKDMWKREQDLDSLVLVLPKVTK